MVSKSSSGAPDKEVKPFGYRPAKLRELDRIAAERSIPNKKGTAADIRPFGADAFEKDATDYLARPDLRETNRAD